MLKRLMSMCLLCLLSLSGISCGVAPAIGEGAAIISAASTTALVAHKFCPFDWWCDEKVLYTSECSWATEHEFTDEAIAGMDEEDLNWAVSHNEKVKKFCSQ